MDTTEPTQLNQLVAAIWGEIKTCKSTLALSWPKPMVHFDFDLGFHRAEPTLAGFSVLKVASGTPLSTLSLKADVITKPYPLKPKWGTKIEGCIALWNEIIADLKTVYEDPNIKTLVFDTSTLLWKIRTGAHLEKVQQKNPERVRLSQMEYSEPNADMGGMLGACRTYEKNLALVHHVGGIYQDKLTQQGVQSMRIGDTLDGFSHTGKLVDMIIHTDKVEADGKAQIKAKILTCGLTLAAEGQEFINPSFDKILACVNSLRGVK
jgi:hypothetical protein